MTPRDRWLRRYGSPAYFAAGFDESKVNRDGDGKFAPKGTTSGGAADEPDDWPADIPRPRSHEDILEGLRNGEDPATIGGAKSFGAALRAFAATRQWPLDEQASAAVMDAMRAERPENLQVLLHDLYDAEAEKGPYGEIGKVFGHVTVGEMRNMVNEAIIAADRTGLYGQFAREFIDEHGNSGWGILRQWAAEIDEINAKAKWQQSGPVVSMPGTHVVRNLFGGQQPGVLAKSVRAVMTTGRRLVETGNKMADEGWPIPSLSVGGQTMNQTYAAEHGAGVRFSDVVAYYNAASKTVQFNPSNTRWAYSTDGPVGRVTGDFVARNDRELLIHEFAHAYHAERGGSGASAVTDPDFDTTLAFLGGSGPEFTAMGKISRYATESPGEFVAEYFTAKKVNHPNLRALTPDERDMLDRLYARLGGPPVGRYGP